MSCVIWSQPIPPTYIILLTSLFLSLWPHFVTLLKSSCMVFLLLAMFLPILPILLFTNLSPTYPSNLRLSITYLSPATLGQFPYFILIANFIHKKHTVIILVRFSNSLHIAKCNGNFSVFALLYYLDIVDYSFFLIYFLPLDSFSWFSTCLTGHF